MIGTKFDGMGARLKCLNAAPEKIHGQPRTEDDNECFDQPLIETLRPAGSNIGAGNCAGQRRVQKRLATAGQTIFPLEMQTPSALAAFQQAEIEKWWPIIREANLKSD